MIRKTSDKKEQGRENAGEKVKLHIPVTGKDGDTVRNEEFAEGAAAGQQESQETDRLRSRIEELEGELLKQQEQAGKFRDELLRKAAEFENFRKQKEREVVMSSLRALENTIRELLPLVDDLNRVLAHLPSDPEKTGDMKPFIDGVELIRKNLDKWLLEKGVKAIESKGQKLDVNYHEAISQIDHPDAEPETIIEEYQTGYLLGEKVIRHAKVIVAR
ncbi:MAG: nucleotide exchange factor GrpE [Chlorobiaceae bacterium]|nr:nucleotide exchange factor GrpE [Chlorobiaceae bacterium]NTV60021.1 nucleotide exchange factor GrpE [Chlorobiaceae bacterium]